MLKNLHIWGLPLVYENLKRLVQDEEMRGLKHILFCMADHFEPYWNDADQPTAEERVRRWVDKYPEFASSRRDSNGRPIQHTWFCAAEQYNPGLVDELSKLCRQGFGEIELHLHHGNDTSEMFRQKLEQAKKEFSRHGALLTKGNPPQCAFGFIHGDWALNNSREGNNLCGVNNELRTLRDTGCYADFTLPSAPHESQTRKVNSIYYAKDIPGKRKSHNNGIDVEVGKKYDGDLMLIQGPLALNWRKRKFGFLPRIENGCIQRSNPGTPDRINLWVEQQIHVRGRPEWIFIKIYCHGAQEEDIDVLLGEMAHKTYSCLEERYNDGKHYVLHYVTAREMYNIVKAAEAGKTGNPFLYKDYLIRPYLNSANREIV